jgi:hypothetical protein
MKPMTSTDESPIADVLTRAEDVAARIDDAGSFAETGPAVASAYDDLLRAVRAVDARYAFDRDGRPGAIAAVREALPLMERDLFEAVLDDHACEIAAIEEALFQVLRAYGRRVRTDTA